MSVIAVLAKAGAWAWESYGEDFLDWAKEKVSDKAQEQGKEIFDAQWKKFKWREAEEKYRAKMARLYGQTRILGNSEPTPLEGIFTDLYILDKPLALRRYDLDDLQASDDRLHGRDIERINGVEFVKSSKNNKLFILGKPGAGKTTFLKYLTVQTLTGELPYTPIFVGLREWSDSGKPLMTFIAQQFEECDFPKAEKFIDYLLKKQRAILLFDGLDEVNAEHLARVQREVKSCCRQYDQATTLITCRVASADYSFEAFNYVEVADFTPAQVAIFVRKWFANEPSKGEKFLTDFEQAEHRGLQELARSPLLLGMLCLAFSDSMEFTSRRADIYEDAIDALLRKWDSSRAISRDGIYKNMTHHLKKRVFSAIAYQTFAANQYLLKESKLAELLTTEIAKLPEIKKPNLDGEAVLKKIEEQHGIFVERAQKIHSFAHLTFQEYFTALAIKGNANYQRELMQHIHDPRWHEVFLLTASLLDNTDTFFEDFLNTLAHDPVLHPALRWCENKYADVKTLESEVGRYIALSFAMTLDLDLNTPFARALTRALDLGLDLNTSLAQIIALDRTLNSTLDRALDRALDFASRLADTAPALGRDYLLLTIHTLVRHWEKTNQRQQNVVYDFIQKSAAQCREWGVPLDLVLPSLNASPTEWDTLRNTLDALLAQHHFPKMFQTRAEADALNAYLAGNRLLLDCLAVATVTDRAAIRNRLFLPPNNQKPQPSNSACIQPPQNHRYKAKPIDI